MSRDYYASRWTSVCGGSIRKYVNTEWMKTMDTLKEKLFKHQQWRLRFFVYTWHINKYRKRAQHPPGCSSEAHFRKVTGRLAAAVFKAFAKDEMLPYSSYQQGGGFHAVCSVEDVRGLLPGIKTLKWSNFPPQPSFQSWMRIEEARDILAEHGLECSVNSSGSSCMPQTKWINCISKLLQEVSATAAEVSLRYLPKCYHK